MTKKKVYNFSTNRKLLVLGDTMSGKTCLLYAFKNETYTDTDSTTNLDIYGTEVDLDGNIFRISLFDIPGDDEYALIRPFAYPHTDVALICFSIGNPMSTKNVGKLWRPEIRHHCSSCPLILVGCKMDLRTDRWTIQALKALDQKPVSFDDGLQIASQIAASAYLECSAKTREGIHELLIQAARLSFNKRDVAKSKQVCTLL